MQNINKIVILTSLLGLTACSSGSSGSSLTTPVAQWTWVGGSNTTDSLGNYGTQGIPASGNIPGARYGAISWTGTDGKFWLFGGNGYDSLSSDAGDGNLNDLWSYDPVSNQWTWMKGSDLNSNNANDGTLGIYGTQGVGASSNQPGARLCPVSWTDSHGRLWLFGGDGYAATRDQGLLNDLWQYNPTTNQWMWVRGESTINSHGNYGTIKTPDNMTQPGSRLCALSWVDNEDNLWLFGGQGYDDGTLLVPGYLNDLWKYNPNTNQWTWVSGDKTANTNGVYGIQTVSSLQNKPGGRIDAVGWVESNGNLWLFGGKGEDANGTSLASNNNLNDLWKYDPAQDIWTWMSGSNLHDAYGTYGEINISSPNSIPGARFRKVPFSWVDNSGNLWMFGGAGNSSSDYGFLNDLWKYDVHSNQWTWVGGSNESSAAGVYGNLGVSAISNMPGARSDAVGWIDSNKNIWVFGGAKTSPDTNFNDLWKYTPVN